MSQVILFTAKTDIIFETGNEPLQKIMFKNIQNCRSVMKWDTESIFPFFLEFNTNFAVQMEY